MRYAPTVFLLAWGLVLDAAALALPSETTWLAIGGLACGAAALLLAATLQRGPGRRVQRAWEAQACLAPADCLWLATGFGLATGIVEVVVLLVRRHLFDTVLKESQFFVWMVPLSYLMVFAIVGAVLALLARTGGGKLPARPVLFVLGFLAMLSQCGPFRYDLGTFAMVVLVVGVATALMRGLTPRITETVRLSRRAVPWLTAAVAVVAAAMMLWPIGHVASSTAEAPAGAPNVLLVVLDTVRADHFGCYGYPKDTTPTFDALAKRSVVFDRAYSTAPYTLTSHATMFTGCYPHETSADWLAPLDGARTTLAEVMAGDGYDTGGFVGNLGYCAAEWGLARGFAGYDDFHVEPLILAGSSGLGRWAMASRGNKFFQDGMRNDADTVTDAFLGWLNGKDEGRPFFAFLNYFDCHRVYDAPPPFKTKFGHGTPHTRDEVSKRTYTPDEMQGLNNAYDGCLAYIDSQFERLMRALRDRGELEHTIVVVTADHGELFGEHGLTGHGNSLYRPLLHVPLIVSLPDGSGAGRRVESVVSLRDLPRTLLALAGVSTPAPFPGHSLVPLWNNDGGDGGPVNDVSPAFAEVSGGINRPPWMPIAKGDMKCVFSTDREAVLNGDGTVELFDLAEPMMFEHNLARKPDGEATARGMLQGF